MKYLFVILFVLAGGVAKAQFPSQQNPTQFSTGWFKQGWPQADSGHILAVRPPNFTPRFPGTTILYQNNGSDTSIHYWTGGRWIKINAEGIDTTPLHNQIVLKLNISDTTGKWLARSTRLVDTVYRVNDSTIGYTIKGNAYTFQILGRSSGGGGSGLTSVGLSMPSAFSVSGSPLTSNGTINVSGAGSSSQYIRGNGTLATTDTGMIPNFYLKVRGLLSGTSPITFNQFTGGIGINNANNSGTKGAASFTSAFSDNGLGLIDLADIVSSGSCTNCAITFDAKGRATAFSTGIGPSGSTVDTIFRTPGIDSIYFTINSVQYAIKDSIGQPITASNGLTKIGNDIRLGASSGPGAPLINDTYIDAGSFIMSISGSNASNAILGVTNSSGGYAIDGTSSSATGAGIHAFNSASGIALAAEVLGGKAAYITATSGIPLFMVGQPSNANGNTIMAEYHRQTSGTASAGISQSFDYWSQLNNNTNDTIARVVVAATNATAGSQTGAYDIWLKNNAASLARKARLAGTGQWTWDGYPALGAQTDTTTYKPVAIDGSGNVVKMAGWAGSFRQSVATSVVGRSANSAGDVADIQATIPSTYLKRDNTPVLKWDSIDYAEVKNTPSTNPGVYFSPAESFDPSFVVFASAIVYPTNSFSHGTPVTWGILDQATGHNSSFMDSAYGITGNQRLGIRYPTVKNVLNHTITPDESFSGQSVAVGATVGLNLSESAVYRGRSIGVRLTGDGAGTWTKSGGLTSAWDVTTYNTGDGGTSFNVVSPSVWGTDFDGLNIQYIGPNNYHIKRVYSGLGAYNARFVLLDEFGNFVSTNPTTTDEIVISNAGMQNVAVPMATWSSGGNEWMASSFNWWVFGTFECWLVAAPVTSSSIQVRWQPLVPSATNYKIYRATSLYGARTLVHTGTDGSFIDAGLSTGTLYWYFMIATIASVDTEITYFRTSTKAF